MFDLEGSFLFVSNLYIYLTSHFFEKAFHKLNSCTLKSESVHFVFGIGGWNGQVCDGSLLSNFIDLTDDWVKVFFSRLFYSNLKSFYFCVWNNIYICTGLMAV